MPRDASITPADLVGKLTHVSRDCPRRKSIDMSLTVTVSIPCSCCGGTGRTPSGRPCRDCETAREPKPNAAPEQMSIDRMEEQPDASQLAKLMRQRKARSR